MAPESTHRWLLGRRLGQVQRRILVVMEDAADDRGVVQISRKQIVAQAGIDPQSVKQSMMFLRRLGLIETVVPSKGGRGKGVPPTYRLTYFLPGKDENRGA